MLPSISNTLFDNVIQHSKPIVTFVVACVVVAAVVGDFGIGVVALVVGDFGVVVTLKYKISGVVAH